MSVSFPKFIIIRDDDVSAFTCLDQFKRAHRLLLDNGIPLNAAVVPNAYAGGRSNTSGYEGFIPPETQGQDLFYPISEHENLVAFLRETESIEIAQHGFAHARHTDGRAEFDDANQALVSQKLDKGFDLLYKTFGKKPAFFVPPYDQVSRIAMEEIRKRFHGISLSRIGRELLPIHLWPKHILNKRSGCYHLSWGKFHVLQHPGIDFSMMNEDVDSEKIADITQSVKDILVITVHSWMFFSPDGALNEIRLGLWETFLEGLIKSKKIKFLGFSKVGKI